MLILYYWPGASSMVPHIVLEEIGEPYERQLVNLAQGEHKSGAYLKINPHGKVPALAVDGNGTYGKRRHLGLSGKAIPGNRAFASWDNRRSAPYINDGVVREHRSSDLLRTLSGLSVLLPILPHTSILRTLLATPFGTIARR
jgi:Glutathione S-transferase, N-terminal domain